LSKYAQPAFLLKYYKKSSGSFIKTSAAIY